MKKIFIIILVVLLLLTGCKPKDRITDEQRKAVEEECRSLITSWETYAQAYREGDTEAKESANKTAAAYNEFLQKNSYVFGETLPEGIYAAIEPIE